jgi:hypothetical protein
LSEPGPRKPQASGMRSSAARSRCARSLATPSQIRDFLIDTGLLRLVRETSSLRELHRGDEIIQLDQRRHQPAGVRHRPGRPTRAQEHSPHGVLLPPLPSGSHGSVPALAPQTRFVFGNAEAGFWDRAAVANHFIGRSTLSTIDFSAVQGGASRFERGRLR